MKYDKQTALSIVEDILIETGLPLPHMTARLMESALTMIESRVNEAATGSADVIEEARVCLRIREWLARMTPDAS